MATIHSELPEDRQGHHGEFVVGQILIVILDLTTGQQTIIKGEGLSK